MSQVIAFPNRTEQQKLPGVSRTRKAHLVATRTDAGFEYEVITKNRAPITPRNEAELKALLRQLGASYPNALILEARASGVAEFLESPRR